MQSSSETMSENIDLLARVRAEAHNVQQWSAEIVNDYFYTAGKTDDALEHDILSAQLTHAVLKDNYDALVREAGQCSVLLTRDTPGFEEKLSAMRKERRRARQDDSLCQPAAWEASYAFPTDYDFPHFRSSLTPIQVGFWQENERLRQSILRAWTMYKDLQWRLTPLGYGNQIHADTRYDFDITGNEPELSRVDGIKVSTFTAWDPFVDPYPETFGTGHSPTNDGDSLFGSPLIFSDDEPDEAVEVASDGNDTIYVNTDDELTEVPSESADSADLPHWNYRDYPTSDEGQSSPAGPVRGLKTQAGWKDSSPFGLPKSRTRLRYSRAPSRSQQAPAPGHTRGKRSSTRD